MELTRRSLLASLFSTPLAVIAAPSLLANTATAKAVAKNIVQESNAMTDAEILNHARILFGENCQGYRLTELVKKQDNLRRFNEVDQLSSETLLIAHNPNAPATPKYKKTNHAYVVLGLAKNDTRQVVETKIANGTRTLKHLIQKTHNS